MPNLLGSMNMPRDGAADPVACSLSKIFCERASFELKDDDIQAYRSRIRQQAANIVAKAQEDEEYLAWKVGSSLSTFSLPGSHPRHLSVQCFVCCSVHAGCQR